MTARMIRFHIPNDERMLAALGKVALRHEHLNHILKMTIKTIAELTPEQAMDALKYEGSRNLRQRINKLAKKKLGEGAPLLKIQAFLGRAKRLTEKRNQLVHGLWAEELDGDAGIMGTIGELNPLPSIDELNTLAKEIELLTEELNHERLDGFIKEALDDSSA